MANPANQRGPTTAQGFSSLHSCPSPIPSLVSLSKEHHLTPCRTPLKLCHYYSQRKAHHDMGFCTSNWNNGHPMKEVEILLTNAFII
ncbi:uncharacterized protein G2W53_032075 [Senna tora]|uniref:Uncharacterized protein n=1 Tax=Senna tora TaxID=362788 RepID=A0A834WBG6_9FABA|nr:uncharacterized protein G2W53_032075 [Senna tora]